MTKLHEKSPCCRGKVVRFGGRRRQCTVCRKTWRVWQRRPGTKPLRPPTKLLLQYLDNDYGPLTKQARRKNLEPATLRARVRKALDRFVTQVTWPDPPKEPLIVIADAMIQRVKKEFYTLHFILLRGVGTRKAIITGPTLNLGTETWLGWRKSFLTLPSSSRDRIEALVCDGHVGLVSLARDNRWLLQRCHFHTHFGIANYVSSGPLSRNRKMGIRIHGLVEKILVDPSEMSVKRAVEELTMLHPTLKSRGLKKVISGFISNYPDHRTYLYYPELNLPTTTNSVESLISSVRDLQYRARGFSSLDSLNQWIEALLKHKRTITCNGKIYQPK